MSEKKNIFKHGIFFSSFSADKSGGGQTFFAFLIAALSLLLGKLTLISLVIQFSPFSVVATVPFSLYMCVKVIIRNLFLLFDII